jgi:hypothetical protein
VSSFDCTTDFEYTTAGATAHHTQSLGEISWIAKLITVEISLDASLGASILRLQTALKLRGEVLQEVNRMLQAELATEIIDDILSILRDTRVIADLHVRLICMFRDSFSYKTQILTLILRLILLLTPAIVMALAQADTDTDFRH